jgi:hypothetical protein
MKITWIDKRSTLIKAGRKFKAGDIIPAGILSVERIDEFVDAGKILLGDPIPDPTVKTVEIMGMRVESHVIEGAQEPEPEKPVTDNINTGKADNPEPKKLSKKEKKEKARLFKLAAKDTGEIIDEDEA